MLRRGGRHCVTMHSVNLRSKLISHAFISILIVHRSVQHVEGNIAHAKIKTTLEVKIRNVEIYRF